MWDDAEAKPCALCFDLDGVLWDTSVVHDQAFRAVCQSHGLRPVAYAELAGRPTPAAWMLILTANEVAPEPKLIDDLTVEKQALARAALRRYPPLSPGVMGILAAAGSWPTALVTGSSAATAQIFLDAVMPFKFDAVVSAETVEAGKPAPAPYLRAAEELSLSPTDIWVLEDSGAGLESAVAAGTRVVHLSNGGPCQMGHKSVVACVSELKSFVDLVAVSQRESAGTST